MNKLKTLILLTVAITITGCGGGTAVEEQERFQKVMNRSNDAAAAQAIRSQVSTLRGALLGGGEGSEVAQMEIDTMMEDQTVISPEKFSDEHKPTVSSIIDKIQELKHAQGRSEQKDILDKLEELCDTLPKA